MMLRVGRELKTVPKNAKSNWEVKEGAMTFHTKG
jgi:hypothetical protein